MKKWVGMITVFSLLLFSVLAELPPLPPPEPGGFEGSTEEQVTATGSSSASDTDAIDVSIQELQQKIVSLEAELSEAKDKLGNNSENSSGLLSIPFIISFSVNITLLVLLFYLLKKSREQAPQY